MSGSNVLVLRAFQFSCTFSAAPMITEVSFRCESANVSGTVTSQASGLPRDHELSVSPSRGFPSVLDKPAGSLETEILARLTDLYMM